MPGETPLPALDPMPVPGPPGLFHVLWLVTFAVHVVGVNVVLGSSILGTFASLDRDRAFGLWRGAEEDLLLVTAAYKETRSELIRLARKARSDGSDAATLN